MDIKQNIEQALQQLLSPELFVVDIQVKAQVAKQKISIMLDGDTGVGIDDCASISRQLSALIEEHNWIESAYLLEVSSPGAEAPLKNERQYAQHIGRKIEIKLNDGTKIAGKLLKKEEQHIEIDTQEKNKKQKKVETEPQNPLRQIALEQIQEAKILISFD